MKNVNLHNARLNLTENHALMVSSVVMESVLMKMQDAVLMISHTGLQNVWNALTMRKHQNAASKMRKNYSVLKERTKIPIALLKKNMKITVVSIGVNTLMKEMHQNVSQKKNVAHLIKNSIYSVLVNQNVLSLMKFVLIVEMLYVVKSVLNLNKNVVKNKVKNIHSVNTQKSAQQVHAVIPS